MIEFLSRLSTEPDPAVVAERQQRMRERLLFRAMVADVVRRAAKR